MRGEKANVLLVGGGGVGTVVALNIEKGGMGAVTMVLRSNFKVVNERGYQIESVDHGKLSGWKPTRVINSVPNVLTESIQPFDYVIAVTKNYPDIPPSLSEIIAPAVTPNHTIIVMIQNGLNIEKPMFAAFPTNVILSGVSMIDSHETNPGDIHQGEGDVLHLGAFRRVSPADRTREDQAAHDFIAIYGAARKTKISFSEDVQYARWRKLVYNAVLNPLCAITGLDDGRVRISDGMVHGLVRPAMNEIIAIAKALGHELPQDIAEQMLNLYPTDAYIKPSMQCDVEKGNYMEFEYLIGEPLREAEKAGVPAPNLKVIYELSKALQWKTKESKGAVRVAPKREI